MTNAGPTERETARSLEKDRWIQGCSRVPQMRAHGNRRTHRRDRLLACALSLFALLVVACGEGNGATNCLPEDVARCTCADGRAGFTVCDPEAGAFYGACNCDLAESPYLPEAGVEASAGDGASDGGDGGLEFMSPCSTEPGSPRCPSGTSCDEFPAKGQFCSKPCKEATDCPAPSPGCNMMGVCKAP
jgi:hypothetical protein